MELLNIARDCFYFVTKFFEVISLSATHIYHSALELSPLSSIVRRLYHHRSLTPSPRVVIGPEDSWKPSIAIPNKDFPYKSCAWSPCGQFIAAQTEEAVEIRDPLTFELLSTLQAAKPTLHLTGSLAYSPDGRSLCCTSNTTIVIWDIQTGGLMKGIEIDTILDNPSSLVWSSDGLTLGAVLGGNSHWSVVTCDIASGKTLCNPLVSVDKPYLWAHGKSFHGMAMLQHDTTYTIRIFKVGAVLTPIRSFTIFVIQGRDFRIGSFSPISQHTSILVTVVEGEELRIVCDRSMTLLSVKGFSSSHCFSSDGKLFAASFDRSIHIWGYINNHYTPWREFPDQGWSFNNLCLQFSPNRSSILGHFMEVLQLWRFDNHPTAPVANSEQYIIFSPHNAYMITARPQGSTVIITNLISQSPPQFIDMDTPISGLALTGNILLVVGSGTIIAWLLTKVGAVQGISCNRRVGCSDKIWAISLEISVLPKFSVGGDTGCIKIGDFSILYHILTGEMFNYGQQLALPSHNSWYGLEVTSQGRYHLPYRGSSQQGDPENPPVPQTTAFREGWVKDTEGKHWLWLPVEWRMSAGCVEWSHHIVTLQVELPGGEIIAVVF